MATAEQQALVDRVKRIVAAQYPEVHVKESITGQDTSLQLSGPRAEDALTYLAGYLVLAAPIGLGGILRAASDDLVLWAEVR